MEKSASTITELLKAVVNENLPKIKREYGLKFVFNEEYVIGTVGFYISKSFGGKIPSKKYSKLSKAILAMFILILIKKEANYQRYLLHTASRGRCGW